MKRMKKLIYDRDKAVSYALKWALNRNPKYFDFSKIGGDCTNFVSQCIYNGCGVMNYKLYTGWFYTSPSLRAPAWTGVNELYNFAVNNDGDGFYAKVTDRLKVMPGDVIQLGNDDGFYHTLIINDIINGRIKVCSHSIDRKNVDLSVYNAKKIRFLHVLGARSV